MATQGHEASFTPPLTPSVHDRDSSSHLQPYGLPMHSHSQDPLLGMNQKLDRMLLLFLEQKALIQGGQEETAEMKKRMDSFAASLGEIKSLCSLVGYMGEKHDIYFFYLLATKVGAISQ